MFYIIVKMPRVKAAQAGRQGPAKRRLAEHFAPGEIITDMTKKEWKLGSPIGQGGFGCIYLGEYTSTSDCRSKDLQICYKHIFLIADFYRMVLIVYINIILLGKNASLTCEWRRWLI